MSFFGDAFKFLSGNSLGANIVKVAALGFASRLLNKSVSPNNTGNTEVVDPGVRLQLTPDTNNKIPVLYGEAYFGGNVSDAVLSADYKTITYALTLSEQTGVKLSTGLNTAYTFNNVYLNGARVVFKADGVTVDYTLDTQGNQDVSYRDLVKIYVYADGPKQPVGYVGTTPASNTVMPGWTALTHPMTGLLYAIVSIQYNRSRGVTGLPDCKFQLTSDMTLPGDVLNDYMLSTVYGAGIAATEIDSSLVALNSFATTGFTYTDALALPQTSVISVNGLLDTNTNCIDNMSAIAESASSWLSYDIHQGKWRVVINKSESSAAAFNDGNIIGEISIGGTELTALNNVVDVKYQNTDILDQTDFVKLTIPVIDLFANELPKTLQLNLPYTNKQAVALKIGLQELKQGRVDKIISFSADYSYINITAGTVIDVTSDVLGFTNKKFRVITADETETDEGSLTVSFQCLEYDEDVYAYDITELTVETDDGFVGTGTIGKPDIPTVTKFEQSNTPRLVITAQVPSGIVDTMQYWITFDTAVPVDSDRAYIQIGTVSNTNGSLLTEGAVVTYTYSQLSQSNFFVKVRGVNQLVSGPYSDPTGLIAYVPVVVADTISDSPVSFGGQIMTLGLLTLLNNLDELLAVFNGSKGILDTVLDIIAPGRTPGTTSIIDILTGDAAFISSVGTATTDIGTYSIDALIDVDTTTLAPVLNYVLAWDGSNWVPRELSFPSGGGIITPPPPPPPPPPPAPPPNLVVSARLPSDDAAWAEPTVERPGNLAPTRGSYYLYFQHASEPFYAPLSVGSGNAELYKSDGTLVETLPAASLIIADRRVEFPFAEREAGTNYFILMDAGLVTYCSSPSPAFTTPTVWNFNTPGNLLAAYVPDAAPLDPLTGPSPTYFPPTLVSANSGSSNCPDLSLVVTYSENMAAGTGTINIYDASNDSIIGTLNAASATVNGATVNYGSMGAFMAPAQTYYALIPAGAAVTNRQDVPYGSCGVTGTFTPPQESSAAVTDPMAIRFSIVDALVITNYTMTSTVEGDLTFNNINVESNLVVTFNKALTVGSGNPLYVTIYRSGGAIHQQFNLKTTFESNFTSDIIRIVGNTIEIDTTKDFESSTEYYVNIAANAVKDSCGVGFNGLLDSTTVRWLTAAGPTPAQVFPVTGTVQAANEGVILEYGQPIQPGPGKIYIYDDMDVLLATLDADDPAIIYY